MSPRRFSTSLHAITIALGAFFVSFGLCSRAISQDVSSTPDLAATSKNILLDSNDAAIKTKYDICFSDKDGTKLFADFYHPQSDTPPPVMLLIHGGGWVAGDKWQIAGHASRIAKAGIAVFSINYRLAPKFKYPAQIDDVREALAFLSTNSDELDIDPQRIGIWGYSAGGHLAALAAVAPETNIPRPLVCIAGGAPCDFTVFPEDNKTLALFLGGSKAEKMATYEQASPVSYASPDDPPFFFFNGDSDLLVPADNSRRLYQKLKEKGVHAEFFLASNQGHLATFINFKAVDAAIAFAKKYLFSDDKQNANVSALPE